MPDVFVARQPIFNRRLDAVGYELLFRHGSLRETVIARPPGGTTTVLMSALTEVPLEQIVGTKLAWVTVSPEFLLSGLAQSVPPGHVGVEIAHNGDWDDRLTAALAELGERNYRIALRDFVAASGEDPLLAVADVVKLDLQKLGPDVLAREADRLRPRGIELLAANLQTRSDQAFCAQAGFDLFQGPFFCEPAPMRDRGLPASRLALLELVTALLDPAIRLSDLEQLISRDVTLSFRLLRYINSAFFGLRCEVRSIGQALALLGVENLRHWATLSVLAGVEDKPSELTITALIRARFCERAGQQLGIARPAELFTLGLFSVIDALLDAPMADVLGALPFPADMREALIHHRGEKGLLLHCVTTLERGDFDRATTIVSRACELYLESVIWAGGASASLFAGAGAETAAA